jgi:N utilization substance protein A
MDIDLRQLREVAADKEIPFSELIDIIEAAIVAAYHKHVGNHDPARAVVDDKTGIVTIHKAIMNEDGDQVGEEEATPENFGRIAAYSAKQVIAQRLREINDEATLGEFKGKEEDIVTGVIEQGPKPYLVYVNLGTVEAMLPDSEQVPGEEYTHGKRMRFYVTKVARGLRGGPIVTVSRSHPSLVRKLFEFEVPEIANREVEIVQVAREAGHRTKIAVRALKPGVNAKGSCIGELGARVRAVTAELNDEKIDIVDYSEDLPSFVAQALSPAKVSSAFMLDAATKHVRALVPDFQLSLAIGKEGQNVRLAARLTGAKIDVQPDSVMEE